MKRKLGTVLVLLGLALLVLGVGTVGRNIWVEEQAGDYAETAMGKLLERMEAQNAASSVNPEQTHPSGQTPENPSEQIPGQTPGQSSPQPGASQPNPQNPAEQAQAERRPMNEISIDSVAYVGYLEIPALDLRLPVISKCSEELLELAPCRYFGTVYQKNFVIGGHRYRRHFRKLYTLGYGDRVTFVTVSGETFHYRVEELEVVQPHQSAYVCSGDWDLSLFTCTTGGQSRVVVRCLAI